MARAAPAPYMRVMRNAVLMAVLLASPLTAAVFGPTGPVRTESAQIAAILAGDQCVLMVRPTIQVGEAEQDSWLVLPLDQNAASVRTTSGGHFREMSELHDYAMDVARRQWREKTDLSLPFLRGEQRPAKPDPIITHPTDREATPVGDVARYESLAALSDAIAELGLSAPGLPEVAEGGCYLLMHVRIPAGAGPRARLPILEITIHAGVVPLPLRTFTGAGLELHVLSDRPLAGHPWSVARDTLKAATTGYVQMMNLWTNKSVPNALPATANGHEGRWFINRILVAELPQLESELALSGGGLEDEIPGFWYYGDGETSWLESLFRRHGLAVVFTTGALLFGSLLVSNFIHRRRKLTAARRA